MTAPGTVPAQRLLALVPEQARLVAMAQRILLVEDEPAIADAVEYALTSEGLRVIRTATLAAARAAWNNDIDLIVLDVGLPDGNGFDFCRELRQHASVPILFLTARADEVDRVVGLEIGGDDYVVKPFSPRELAARVRAVLRRSGRHLAVDAAGPTATSNTITIDEASRTATWRGQPLGLTRYQFRLLSVLAAQPGRVYSRSQLLDLVWDDPTATVDRGVDHVVKGLRARLRTIDATSDDPIVTHRGDGYSLRADLT
jgi:two-component system, OmpR family, catabolic regulation response regulator CreB